MEEGKTFEWCSECDSEVEIPDNEVSNCPDCGKEILPCSTCEDTANRCNWTKENRCYRFPL